MADLIEYQKPFAAVIPAMSDFSQKHNLVLRFDTGLEDRFGEPYFQLFWLNQHGCFCYLTVVYREPLTFRFSAVCYGTHDKLGDRFWEPILPEQVDLAVAPLLSEALEWSNTFKQQRY